MRTACKILCGLLLVCTTLIVIGVTTAQEPGGEPKKPEPTNTVTDAVFIIACDADPKKLIVLDSMGKWLSDVKSTQITFALNSQPVVVCTMYQGLIRPTQPKIGTWKLAQFKSVSLKEFQDMIDALQKDPDAVRKMLEKKTGSE